MSSYYIPAPGDDITGMHCAGWVDTLGRPLSGDSIIGATMDDVIDADGDPSRDYYTGPDGWGRSPVLMDTDGH